VQSVNKKGILLARTLLKTPYVNIAAVKLNSEKRQARVIKTQASDTSSGNENQDINIGQSQTTESDTATLLPLEVE
jgi:hypothetical protein